MAEQAMGHDGDLASHRPHLVGTQPRSRLPVLWVSSLVRGRARRRLFEQVERYCMFVGYPRSGHSLFGSLLDAHADVVLAHELDALRLMRFRFNRDQLFSMILANEASFTESGRLWTNSAYTVPDQWQGSFRRLRVIGDKKGGQSTRRLRSNPALLDRLRATVRVPLRAVHVIRNPYDNIASMILRRDVSLQDVIEDFFGLCDAMDELSRRFDATEILSVRYESLVRNPAATLRELCAFVDVEPEPGFIEKASSILKNEPSRTRDRVEWTPRQLADIQERSERYAHLAGYSIDQ
jgi:sulfotransferase family protein